MSCSFCGAEKVLARGYCSACYTRLRRNGSLDKTNIPNTGKCSECGQPVMAKGLCSLHYARQQHPLKNTWKLIRSRYPGNTPKKWGRFDVFLADVGERPSERHQLRRVDETKAYSARNVRWVEPVLNGNKDYFTPEERALYVREWTLNRKYNIGKAEYDAMLEKQNGVCAICYEAEVFVNKKTGKLQEFSVDHDHKTGDVRGLLCVRCNRMLGYARDNKEILSRAITYLSPPEA
jgi:hypothetical protein